MEHTIATNEPGKKTGKFSRETDGIGYFTLSFAFNEDVENEVDGKQLEEVREYLQNVFFPIVSLILERATHGQHKLKLNLDKEQDSIEELEIGSSDADILITWYNTNVFGRIWNNGQIEFSINHIYSPGLMLHELGHYLYHLGDEYAGCRRKRNKKGKPGDPASIMEYSFGNNTRFKTTRNMKGQEYKVMERGGVREFKEDFDAGKCQLEYKSNKVVTDFCTDSDSAPKKMKHVRGTGSEQNEVHNKSCWSVMIDDSVGGAGREKYQYGLQVPFDPGFDKNQFRSRLEIENELETKFG